MTDAPTLLLVEDTASLQVVYRSVLEAAGYRVEVAPDGTSGLTAFRRLRPAAVLLDIMLPDRDGLTVMQEMLEEQPDARIIVITSNGSINKAVEAMRGGAQDFLVKPFDEARFLAAVRNALRSDQPASAPAPATLSKPAPAGFRGLLGSSPAIRQVEDRVRSVARSMASVFITGESGTGKELCAQAIHDLSPRARGPFIVLNCGAIPADLMESEVFGHIRGAFPGAVNDKAGAAVVADGGTLFLDEICEMDLALQPKILRFLQTSSVTPVGAARPRRVDVRIICATNRDPTDAVRRGILREDLYYRLHVVPIRMPALRDRGDDVIGIAEAALASYAVEEGRRFTGLTDEVRKLFLGLPWPGNVRQVLNVMRNVVVLHDGELVTAEMLPDDLMVPQQAPPPPMAAAAPVSEAAHSDELAELLAGRTLAQIERLAVEAAISRHSGSLPRAARELGVAASTLYRKREGWASDS
ncbi:two component, sigma54 specific, transcriptional regulator, Fis family [Gemmobacter megaterium]|uniref:Nif-specific regulatory protein n=1 Tax=Gemmobacter megaterium TaxID=1086013 RepID=A0A1N7KCY2_9RHOB|nr:sigma-54 dependent transcriptional regulator [Gemmobacter megaterium]GGE01377.1 sigma-54-dependent Fis family transcriptional regulator [Gemmobacter megaterium]SIS59340.1 two component, sigma54 specific, transcriptional regulator, Fis family [Gemmobacter megaterium]